jgi:nucleoside phosphorylase
LITLIASSFQEINQFIQHGRLLRHYSANNLDIKNIEFNSKNINIIKSGVGIKNARIASNYAVNNLKSEKIYFVGVCGALDSGLQIGDIIVGKWVCSLKKNRKINLSKLNCAFSNKIKTGGILTSNKFANTSSGKHALYLNTQALVVDMETWGAAQICEKTGTAIYGIRSVSDLKTDNLPDLGYIYNTGGHLDKTKSLKYFSKNPYMFYKGIEFKFFKLKRASKSLSDFLSDLFNN